MNAVYVPNSIDSTGSKDVSAQLQSFIDEAPNGSTIVFKAGGAYRLDEALRITGRRNLTLEGNGARLDLPRTDQSSRSTGIQVRDGSAGTTIRDFVMVGNNSQAGTSDACCTRENNHAIAVLSASDTLIEKVDISRTWGDCLYASASSIGGRSVGITFRDSTCRLTGRHGVGIIAANDVHIVNNAFDEIGPNGHTGSVQYHSLLSRRPGMHFLSHSTAFMEGMVYLLPRCSHHELEP